MNLMRYNLKRNHVLMYVTKHIMHFKIERPTIHNCSSCIGNINVMWQLWDAMQVYVKLYQTKHFKCFFRNKDTHASVTMTHIHAHQTYVFLGFFLKTHGKLLYLRLTTFNVSHMMLIMFTWPRMHCSNVYCWSFFLKIAWKASFSYIWTFIRPLYNDNVNLTLAYTSDNGNLTYTFIAVIYC